MPALIGGRWARDLDVSAPESPYLAFIVGLHVATAAALLLFFWRDWVQIVTGLYTSVRYRRIQTTGERLAWLLIVGTIPVAIVGLALEHTFRTTLGRPIPAAAFLVVNGVLLYAGERLRRRLDDGADRPLAGANPMLAGARTRRAGRRRAETATAHPGRHRRAARRDLAEPGCAHRGGADPGPAARDQPVRA